VDANGWSNRLVIDLHTRQAHTEGGPLKKASDSMCFSSEEIRHQSF
jgi:hypothetical protein